MNNILVIDDMLTNEEANLIEDVMLRHSKQISDITFPWYNFETFSANSPESIERHGFLGNNILEKFAQCHMFIEDNQSTSLFSKMLEDTILKNFNIDYLFRVKSNLTFQSQEPNTISTPHYDNEEEHLAAVYYVNDCDGDTIIYNEIKTYQNNKLSTRVRVSPKKGRMVLFNGMHLHTSEYPYTNDMRAIINFNFGPKTMLKG